MVRWPIDPPRWRLMMRPLLSVTVLVLLISAAAVVPAGAAPDGQVTWGIHISLAPTWFDPAETTGIVTPFMVLYALHDAMVKPLPGNPLAPSLAESWTVSRRRARVRVRPAQRREVPQRRAGHRRGRQVLVRALPGRREQDLQGTGGGGRDSGSGPRPLPPEGSRGPTSSRSTRARPAPGGSCPRSTSRRSATTASRRRRSAPAPTGSSRSRRASSSCWRPSTGTGARRRR